MSKSASKLSLAIAGVRYNNISSFEDFYILTYREVYDEIACFMEEEKDIWQILKYVYIGLWDKAGSIPEENLIRPWLKILIKNELKKQGFTELPDISDMPGERSFVEDKKREAKAMGILLELEEDLGFLEEEKDEDGLNLRFILFSVGSLCIIAITLFLVIFNLNQLQEETGKLIQNPKEEQAFYTTKEALTIEDAQAERKYGWNEDTKGKKYLQNNGEFVVFSYMEYMGDLYYFDEEGYLVSENTVVDGRDLTIKDGKISSISMPMNTGGDDTYLSRFLVQYGYDNIKEAVIEKSILPEGNRIFYMAKTKSGLAALLRLDTTGGYMEILETDISGYVSLDDTIWISKQGESGFVLKSILKTAEGEALKKEYSIGIENDSYVLYDIFGDVIQSDENLNLGTRVYKLDESGAIKYVKPGKQSIGAYTFTISDNHIMANSAIFLTEGICIDAFCVVGDYIYYVAETGMEGDVPISGMYRIDVNTMEREALGEEFKGVVNEMYYYSDTSKIYMEYLPSLTGTLRGGVGIFDIYTHSFHITGEISAALTSYMYEVIMVENNSIYTYLHEVEATEDGSVRDLSKKTVVLVQ